MRAAHSLHRTRHSILTSSSTRSRFIVGQSACMSTACRVFVWSRPTRYSLPHVSSRLHQNKPTIAILFSSPASSRQYAGQGCFPDLSFVTFTIIERNVPIVGRSFVLHCPCTARRTGKSLPKCYEIFQWEIASQRQYGHTSGSSAPFGNCQQAALCPFG